MGSGYILEVVASELTDELVMEDEIRQDIKDSLVVSAL